MYVLELGGDTRFKCLSKKRNNAVAINVRCKRLKLSGLGADNNQNQPVVESKYKILDPVSG